MISFSSGLFSAVRNLFPNPQHRRLREAVKGKMLPQGPHPPSNWHGCERIAESLLQGPLMTAASTCCGPEFRAAHQLALARGTKPRHAAQTGKLRGICCLHTLAANPLPRSPGTTAQPIILVSLAARRGAITLERLLPQLQASVELRQCSLPGD